MLPREQCQYLALDLPAGLSTSQARAAIALWLRRHDGRESLQFAWRSPAPNSRIWPVWYWHQSEQQAKVCPEPLLSQTPSNSATPLPHGLGLARCTNGFELTFFQHGELVKTRWLPQLPSDERWEAWREECGQLEESSVMPSPKPLSLAKKPPSAWNFYRAQPVSNTANRSWLWAGGAAAIGIVAGLIASLTFSLTQQNEKLTSDLAQLRQQASRTLAMQQQIDTALAQAQTVATQTPSVSRLRVLARLAESPLLGGKDNPYMLEFDDQNGRVRMQLAWPAERNLEVFLSEMESLKIFEGIRFMPNPPPGTLVMMAQVKK